MRANQAAHSDRHHVPRAGRLHQRVLCVAAPASARAAPTGRCAAGADPRVPSAVSRGTYGAPRIHARADGEAGVHVGRKRVARLMRAGRLARRQPPQVAGHDGARDATRARRPISSQRDFTAPAPNQLWVADITYIPTRGRLPLSRRRARRLEPPRSSAGRWRRTCAPSWCSTRSTWRIAAAPARAASSITRTRAASTPSLAFGRRCREAGVRPSMGSVGDAYDNAHVRELLRHARVRAARSP